MTKVELITKISLAALVLGLVALGTSLGYYIGSEKRTVRIVDTLRCEIDREDVRVCEERRLKNIHELQTCQEHLLKYRVQNALELKR